MYIESNMVILFIHDFVVLICNGVDTIELSVMVLDIGNIVESL